MRAHLSVVRSRLPARRRRVRDAARPRRPSDRARPSTSPGCIAPPTGLDLGPARRRRCAPGRGHRRRCSRPRASTAPRATPRCASPCRAGRIDRAACCRPTRTSRPRSSSRSGRSSRRRPGHLERRAAPRGQPGPARPAGSPRRAQDDVARRVRVRPAGGPPRGRRRRPVPDHRRPPVGGTSANLFLVRRGAGRGWSSWRRRRSTARSWPARRGRGCSAGRRRSGCGRSRAGSPATDLAGADEAFLCSSVAGVLPVTRVRRARRSATAVPAPWTAARPRRPRGDDPRPRPPR